MLFGTIALLATFVLFGTVVHLVGRRSRPRCRWRCADCRYLLRSDDDGVLCGHGERPVFKNPVHIANCMNYERRGR